MRSEFELLLPAVLAVGLLVPLASLEGQLQSGQRVRVTALDCGLDNQSATFEALRSDTLVLDTTNCPLVSVTRLDVHRGRRANAGKGAIIGLAIGGGGGAVLGAIAFAGSCIDRPDGCPLAGAAVFALFFGPPSILTGAVIGALIKTDRWEEIPHDSVSLSVGSQRDGRFGLGLSVKF